MEFFNDFFSKGFLKSEKSMVFSKSASRRDCE